MASSACVGYSRNAAVRRSYHARRCDDNGCEIDRFSCRWRGDCDDVYIYYRSCRAPLACAGDNSAVIIQTWPRSAHEAAIQLIICSLNADRNDPRGQPRSLSELNSCTSFVTRHDSSSNWAALHHFVTSLEKLKFARTGTPRFGVKQKQSIPKDVQQYRPVSRTHGCSLFGRMLTKRLLLICRRYGSVSPTVGSTALPISSPNCTQVTYHYWTRSPFSDAHPTPGLQGCI